LVSTNDTVFAVLVVVFIIVAVAFAVVFVVTVPLSYHLCCVVDTIMVGITMNVFILFLLAAKLYF